MDAQDVDAGLAEALFVSDVQRSDPLSPAAVRAAVRRSVSAYGSAGCAALVAQEFGEHPETAPVRMAWALGAVRQCFFVSGG
jgi:hypothetical protein